MASYNVNNNDKQQIMTEELMGSTSNSTLMDVYNMSPIQLSEGEGYGSSLEEEENNNNGGGGVDAGKSGVTSAIDDSNSNWPPWTFQEYLPVRYNFIDPLVLKGDAPLRGLDIPFPDVIDSNIPLPDSQKIDVLEALLKKHQEDENEDEKIEVLDNFLDRSQTQSDITTQEEEEEEMDVLEEEMDSGNEGRLLSRRLMEKMISEIHVEYMYLSIVQDIISTGTPSPWEYWSTLTKSDCLMSFNLRNSFPLLTTKEFCWSDIVQEVIFLINHSKDARKNGEGTYDPVMEIVETIKNDPDEFAWKALLPCHIDVTPPPTYTAAKFRVSKGELSCLIFQNHADVELGVPLYIASYSLLTCLIAHVCDLAPGYFVQIIGDAYVCRKHIKVLQKQLQRHPKPFPVLKINPEKKDIESFVPADLVLLGYDPHKV